MLPTLDDSTNSEILNGISNVFIMRPPPRIAANFLGFDNYSTFYHLTEQLIKKGYTDIAIVTGSHDFFSEIECVNGYCEAHDAYVRPTRPENILCTDMSKEGAFKVTMLYLASSCTPSVSAWTSTFLR